LGAELGIVLTLVIANLIHPLASSATWWTFPGSIRNTSKTDVNLAMKSLMCWASFPSLAIDGLK